jgi:hypothetical protein
MKKVKDSFNNSILQKPVNRCTILRTMAIGAAGLSGRGAEDGRHNERDMDSLCCDG